MSNIQQENLYTEMSQNFIEYAVAVNSDRAIPDAKSGLKPVATRILYGAFASGRTSNKPHVKSARVVGEVMGALHPHGDSSIYGALVRLAQPWIMRYPLIDGHGNFGNIGGDGPAAMRYTEVRLSKLAEDGLLANLKKNNVDFKLNYDETIVEPVTLPAIFPNLLCNPNQGIGVATASSWLPNNLGEVAQAIYDYIDGKEPTLPGPDFPTGGTVINKDDIPNIMKTGHGSVKVRGNYKIEKQNIIFYEIPYNVSTENLLNELGEVCDSKKIEGIFDIRNESNKKGLRIVIECDKGVNPETIVQKIFAETDFQTSISYNQVALVDKTPTELNLIDCIKIYINHNIDCLIKECNFDLKKATDRKEIVDGLLRALEDIDNIINLIKKSESAAAAQVTLRSLYKFTENQAKAIVDMKLGKLAGLEKIELQKEAEEIESEIKRLNNILQNKDVQLQTIRERLQALVKRYGDARRTQLTQITIEPKDKEVQTIIPEDCVVVMSQTGDIKRISTSSFKTQKRKGKGVKTEEALLGVISTNTVDTLMLFTDKGKMYRLLVDSIPVGTNASRGVNISNLIKLENNEKVIAITSLYRKTNAKYIIFITKKGLFKKSLIDEYTKVKRSTGIIALNLKEGDSLANVTFVDNEEFIILTKKGMSIHFTSNDINPIGRTTAGVKSIKLDEDDEVVIGLPIHDLKDNLAIFTKNGYGKKTSLDEFPLQGRAGKGVMAYKISPITGEIVGAAMLSDNDSVILTGLPNSICIGSAEVPLLGRISSGNMMINGSTVKMVTKI